VYDDDWMMMMIMMLMLMMKTKLDNYNESHRCRGSPSEPEIPLQPKVFRVVTMEVLIGV
jgi:hypothetical protein